MPIPELDNFRKKYPQYGDMSDADLANKLASKYPEAYGDLPGKVQPVTASSAAPAPQPQKNYNLSEVPMAALHNVPSSAMNLVKGIGQAVIHPIDTGKGLAQAAAGGVEKLIPESMLPAGRANEKSFDAVMDFFKNRYGGWENLKKTMAEDPVGFAADLSTVLSAGGAGLKALGKVSEATKPLAFTSPLTKAGEVTGAVGKAINPVELGIQAGKQIVKGTGNAAKFSVGLATGKGPDTIKEWYAAGRVGGERQKSFMEALQGKGNDALAQNLRDNYQNIKDIRAAEYTNKLAAIEKQSGGLTLDTTPIDSAIQDVAKRFRIKSVNYVEPEVAQQVNEMISSGVPKQVMDQILTSQGLPTGMTKVKPGWNFEGLSTLTPADKVEFGKMLDMIQEWKSSPKGNTVLGLDSLKQQLDNFYTPNARIGAVATGLRKSVKDILGKNVKGYNEMTAGYEKASNLLKDANSALSIGKKNNTQTIIQKAGTTMREDSAFRRDMVKSMDEVTGRNTYAAMAGSMGNAWLPTGLVGRSMGAGELAAIATGNFQPGLVPLIMMGSPKLMATTANTLGRTVRHISPLTDLIQSRYGLPAFQAGRLEEELKKENQ